MWTSHTIRTVFLILAGSPIGVAAQGNNLATAAAAMRVGQHVRLDVAQTGRAEGRFLNADRSTLTLERNGTPARFQLGDIEQLWERGRSTGRGARIGALVGAAFGIFLGIAVAGACNLDPEPCFTRAEGAVTGAFLFGAGGALLGAGVGFAIPTWHLRFP